MLDSEAQEFVEIIIRNQPESKSTFFNNNKIYYSKLLNIQAGDGEELMNYVVDRPYVLGLNLDHHHMIFDYFFDYAVDDRGHPAYNQNWMEHLIEIIGLLNGIGECGDIIKSDKRYIMRLQKNSNSYNRLFDVLFDNDFEAGDLEFLLYSVITRGEIYKLRKMFEVYSIEECPGIFDIAMRYGRIKILEYLLDAVDIDLDDYGKILNFANIEDNIKYMYYRANLLTDGETTRTKYGPIGSTVQDYVACVKLLMNHYTFEVDITTLEIWCDMIRDKFYQWDVVPHEVLLTIKEYIRDPIPMIADFGEFNGVIFGNDWSDRSFLIAHCIKLQERILYLEDRLARVEYRCRKNKDLK